jgi:hypothetical protein
MHDQDRRCGCDRADRRELLIRVIAHVGIERRIDRHRASESEYHRVSVRRAARDLPRADIAPRTGPILDHHLLSERTTHAFADQPRHDVIAAAGGKRDHQRDRSAGKISRFLRSNGSCRHQKHGRERYKRSDLARLRMSDGAGDCGGVGQWLEIPTDNIATAPAVHGCSPSCRQRVLYYVLI